MSMSAFTTQQALMSITNAVKTLAGFEYTEQQFNLLDAAADSLKAAIASAREKTKAKAAIKENAGNE